MRPLAAFETGWVTPRHLPAPLATLPSVIAERAGRTPNETVLHEVSFAQGEPVAIPCSYQRLLAITVAAAEALRGAGVGKGDRVLLSLSQPTQFLGHLLGAQGLGAIAVPLPSLSELPLHAYVERIAAVARDARPRAFVVDDERATAALPADARPAIAVLDAGRVVATTDTLLAQGKTSPCFESSFFGPERALGETAFLQYTSGSTGDPKGVVVSHYNLLANLRAMVEHARIDRSDIAFSWLPLFHDLGLMAGLLLGVYVGFPTFVAPPKSFVTRPDSWLRAISALRATLTFGPNFAYDLVARRVRDKTLERIDLSCLRMAFDGAEPVAPATVRAFTERFACRGLRSDCIRPAYGMAECTLAVAFPPFGAPVRLDCVDRNALTARGIAEPTAQGAADAVLLTSVGEVLPGLRVRILDLGHGRELPARHLGELVVSGPSVSAGYHDRPRTAGTHEAFELRTGDLAYVADGQLYIVDRLKDLLAIAGRKYVPSDIERVVGAIDGLRAGAVVAFGRAAEEGTEELCIAAAVEPQASAMKPRLKRAIARAVYERFALTAAHILLLRPQDLPKTSSGKLRRSSCLSLLEAELTQAPAFAQLGGTVQDAPSMQTDERHDAAWGSVCSTPVRA